MYVEHLERLHWIKKFGPEKWARGQMEILNVRVEGPGYISGGHVRVKRKLCVVRKFEM
jgi:hypothetical protein